MGKQIVILILGAVLAIGLFGDGGFELSPKLSNDMTADFRYTDNSTADVYNIEKWVENENHFVQSDNPCVIDGEDICKATPLPPLAGVSIPNFGMPASLAGLENWARDNAITFPEIYGAWTDEAKFEWLKGQWESRQ